MIRAKGRLAASSAILAGLLTLLAVSATGDYSAEAHPSVHPQKELFTGRWYKSSADLTTSPPWFGVAVDLNGDGFPEPEFLCDGGTDNASCVSKWANPAFGALNEWNGQPSGARFFVQTDRNPYYDVNVYVVDSFGPPGLLGVAFFYDSAANECSPYNPPDPGLSYCATYYYGDAVIVDDNHTGVFAPTANKKVTVIHEVGHLLTLAHESVNESVYPPQFYNCGDSPTGPVPHSVMAYKCIFPPDPPYYGAGEYYIQDWDTCGVNHAYPDPVYEWESCVCYPPPGGAGPPPGLPAYYHPVTPARILDTRPAPFGPIGVAVSAGRLGHGCHMDVQVTGVPGSGVPASGVSAVVLNVTITQPSRGSYLTVYPSDAGLPLASNLNYNAGQTVPNLVTVKVGADGKVRLYNAVGQTHVIFDVVGWYGDTPDGPPPLPTPTPTPDPGGYGHYHPLPPVRILETRGAPYETRGAPAGKIGPGGPIPVDVTDTYGSGVPPSGVTAVVVNTTVTEPTTGSYLAVYPSDELSPPLVSNLNFGPGQTVPNLVIVKVGSDGKVKVYNAVGSTHVIFDVLGWYGPYQGPAPTDVGTLFNPLSPTRILETRGAPYETRGVPFPGKIGHNSTIPVDVTNTYGSGVPEGAKAVIVNTTVTEPTAGSYLTVYPSGASPPLASNLNFGPGQTVPNLVMIKVGADGKVNVYNAVGQVRVIFDVVGYFE